MRYILITLLIIISALTQNLYSQEKVIPDLRKDCFLKLNEKVYVQLEKYVFISGEPVNYKVYVVNSSSLRKSLQSKIVYFEISGHYGHAFSWRANLNKGLANGRVIIPDSLSSGIYTLRAYTNWMRNTSPEFHYSARMIITKINEPDHNNLHGPETVSFNEIESLPDAYYVQSDYNLSVENILPDRFIINITSNTHNNINNRIFHLVLLLRGQIINNIPVSLNDSVTKINIPKSNISGGIVDIILLNSLNSTVCEKAVYISSENNALINLKTPKKVFGKREKVALELEINNLGDSDTAWLSISVAEKPPEQLIINNTGISSYLSFYSEIAGLSHFSDLPASITDESANNILYNISNDRYGWSQMSNDNYRPCLYIMENTGFVMSGKLLSHINGLPLNNRLVILSFADSVASMKYCYTDTNGNFYFLLDKSYDNRDLILQMIDNNEENENVSWIIDEKSDAGLSINYNMLSLSGDLADYLQHCRDIVLINNIYRENPENNDFMEIPDEISDRRNFCGDPDYTIYPADFVDLIDFKEISQNILLGVRFRGKIDNFQVKIFDPVNDIPMPAKASVLLNGVPFTDLAHISTLGSKDIKKIDVYQTELIFGELTFYGLLSVYTYDGKIPESYLKNFTYEYKNKVQPSQIIEEYNNEQKAISGNTKRPDFRQTLFWKPSITVTGKNKVILDFPASELTGKYNIVVQGITSGGIPLETVTEIEVK